MSSDLSRLRVADEDFLVASMIERCPKTMMLRELVKNAIEAAAGGELRHVEIGAMRVGGVRKLAIWNTGRGMSADELFRMCDIASSIGKANGLDQNFGMGAKVASLPSNQHGIRYRSCRDGRVHQVIMGKRDGWYGRVRQMRPDGQHAEVIDVTDTAAREGYGSTLDWTEVVLMGNHPEQDTLADPYDHAPDMPGGWIPAELQRRFFAMPAGVALMLKQAVHDRDTEQPFRPIRARMATDFERHEAVLAEQGLLIHFLYDPPDPARPGHSRSEREALQPAEPGVALVHKGEIYGVRRGEAWLQEAPSFGFAFGARSFSLYIELPDDHPVLPDAYRQFLRWRENEQHHVSVGHFARQVMAARPGWVLALIRQLAPDAAHVNAARDEMAALFSRLGVRRRWWPVANEAPPAAPSDPAAAGVPESQPPAEPPAETIEYEVPPQIIAVREPDEVRERGLDGTAARFYADTNQLFLNAAYQAVRVVRDLLAADVPGEMPADRLQAATQEVAELTIARQVCRRLAYALAKRDSWAGWQVDQAASPYSLTLAADDHADAMGWARAMLRRHLAHRATRLRTMA